MSKNFGLHFTPDFASVSTADGTVTTATYKYFNNKTFRVDALVREWRGSECSSKNKTLIDEDCN
eukprot:CAMPEP_0172425580 /NCGR_PEP_ID=MMETSP1064-20121228/32815_1 /TAXON_ID=202472 /ORGANISM="Aulacoseira subarctica , Strain CCAP 1002/5" /LENGTH=63 /DNA_ID=CAMNT_0013168561 /DNA_START=247 /DNA_END=438 /DNA_ORIENTATION=-